MSLVHRSPQTFDDATRTCLPLSPLPLGSSTVGSPNGSAPDLDGMGGRPSNTVEDKVIDILSKLGRLDTLHP